MSSPPPPASSNASSGLPSLSNSSLRRWVSSSGESNSTRSMDGNASTIPASAAVSKRKNLQRHWSVGNFGVPPSSTHSRNNSRSSIDFSRMQTLQETWASAGEGTDFLGGSSGVLGSNPPLLTKSASERSNDFGRSDSRHSVTLLSPQEALMESNSELSFEADTVSSAIHDAARITDWDRVLELCESTPEAASFSGRDGWTALHHACNRRCPRPDVVQALIAAYPEALLQEEEKSWLPLHYACRFKAPVSVVRLLLHMFPESGRTAVETKDRQGRRPLYYAVRYDAPQGVAGLLLAVDPSAVLEEDQNEESPLALIWDSWAEKLEGKRIVHSFLPGGFPEPEDTTVEQRAALLRERLQKESKLKKRWNQVNMLLKAAFGFPFEEDDADHSYTSEDHDSKPAGTRKWRIVHATAAVKCHLSLFLLACALHPEQACEMDEFDLRRPNANGMSTATSHQTALHLAASSNAGGEPGKTVVYTLLSLYREAAQEKDGVDGSLPLHLMVENPRKQDWPNHASILYHFYQRAVQISDSIGRLPLHRATAAVTQNVHEDPEHSVIFQLVRSFPQAASHTDMSGKLPFHNLCKAAAVWDDDVEAVHNANRNAIHVRAGQASEFARLPIHMAADSKVATESLIQKLISLHPRGASMEDSVGKLPLHLACETGKPWDHGTRIIYEAFPQAISRGNSKGWLPLHMAAQCNTPTNVLLGHLLQIHAEAAALPDTSGRFPLHLACSAGKSWIDGLHGLFDANPIALATHDNFGLLPLHICALSFCKKEGHVRPQTKAVPKVEAKKEQTVNTEEAAELDILFNLIRADPTTIAS